ncbi:MAG: ATP-binding protein [Actinomycetota bacterium]
MTATVRGGLWAAYLAVSLAAVAVYVVLPLDGLPDGAFYDLFGLAAVGAILAGVRTHRPRASSAWYLIALSQLLFVVGDLFWVTYDVILHIDPWPSVADVFYLAGYPALAMGLLGLIRARRAGRDRKALIDASIVAAGLGLLAWVFLVGPYFDDHSLSPIELSISIAYPLGDLLVMAVAVRLVTGGGFHTPAFRLLGGSLLALLLADVVYGVQQLAGVYREGGLLDGTWLVSYALMAACALHPGVGRLSEPEEVVERPPDRRRLLVLAAAALLAPAATLFQSYRGFDIVDVAVVVASSAGLSLLVVARLAGLVRELDRVVLQLHGSQEERERLVHRTMRASEEERVRIAAELHDGPLQRLAEVGFGLERVRMRLERGEALPAQAVLEPLQEALGKEVHSIRAMMSSLRPPALDEQGLEGALRGAAETFSARTGTTCRLRVDMTDRLEPEAETVLYRVAQEALRNVEKHARASEVDLELWQRDGHVELSVEDDGRGFDPRAIERALADGHLGIVSMRELVRMAGGSFKVESRAGVGTTVTSALPRSVS